MKEAMTIEEIAKVLGITRQSAGEILKNALRKANAKLKDRGLRFEDIV